MGTFWYAHLNRVRTNSYDAGISPAMDPYPVVIYSHAFIGLPTENTILMEELASQGYIVFSIGHSYETIVSVFPEGEVVGTDYEYIFEVYDDNYEQEAQLYEDYDQAASLEEKMEIIRKIAVVDESSNAMISARIADAILLMDELEILNSSNGIFAGMLDLDNVGIMGYSLGGSTAINASISDRRFKAAINIDGWPYGEPLVSDKVMTQPFLLINNAAEYNGEVEILARDMQLARTAGDAYSLTIEETEHTNFWDFPMFFKIYKYLGYWGPIDALRLAEIENAYVTAFFDQYLKGEDVPLLDGRSAFSEVEFEVKVP
jgi:dienelactone hydrolase